jgi:flagellin
MISILSNVAAWRAQNALRAAESAAQASIERISTGKRINSAADDPAAFAIGTRLASEIVGFTTGMRNAQDGMGRVQTADGILAEVTDLVQRMRELALQSATGSYSDSDRAAISAEVGQLGEQVARSLTGATYNGARMFNVVSGSLTNDAAFDLQTGAASHSIVHIAPGSIDLGPLTSASVDTAALARSSLDKYDAFLNVIGQVRAQFGTMSNMLEREARLSETFVANLSEAYGRIMDVDYVAESMALAKAQMLTQASTAMLAQANDMTGELVRLLLKD